MFTFYNPFNNMIQMNTASILPQNQAFLNSFDLSTLELELEAAISSNENSFNQQYSSPICSDQAFNVANIFKSKNASSNEQVWQPLTVNSNTFSSYIQTDSMRTTSTPIQTEKLRAIKKTNYVSCSATQTKPEIDSKSPVTLNKSKPSCEDDKLKQTVKQKLDKVQNIVSPNARQLPLRSKNVDMSNFLKNTNLLSSSCGSSSTSSLNDELYTPPISPQRNNFNKHNAALVKCSFCLNNGEKEEIYLSHPLKDSLGRIVCPILRNFTCPKCGESGDYAHTNKYCPETQRKRKENKIKSVLFNLED